MTGDRVGEGAASLLKEHAAVLGRVAMALLGDAARVEQVLEQVAREAGVGSVPSERPLVWLLGLVRAASAAQYSKLPRRTRSGLDEPSPARKVLGRLKPTEREAVVLSLVGGLAVDDVARACAVDVATARERLAHGLEQMMEVGQ